MPDYTPPPPRFPFLLCVPAAIVFALCIYSRLIDSTSVINVAKVGRFEVEIVRGELMFRLFSEVRITGRIQHTHGFVILGFGGYRADHITGFNYDILVPLLLLTLVFLLLPARDMQRYWYWRKQQRRRAAGLCVHCGYDLRGSGTDCPECGKKVAAETTHGNIS